MTNDMKTKKRRLAQKLDIPNNPGAVIRQAALGLRSTSPTFLPSCSVVIESLYILPDDRSLFVDTPLNTKRKPSSPPPSAKKLGRYDYSFARRLLARMKAEDDDEREIFDSQQKDDGVRDGDGDENGASVDVREEDDQSAPVEEELPEEEKKPSVRRHLKFLAEELDFSYHIVETALHIWKKMKASHETHQGLFELCSNSLFSNKSQYEATVAAGIAMMLAAMVNSHAARTNSPTVITDDAIVSLVHCDMKNAQEIAQYLRENSVLYLPFWFYNLYCRP